MEEQVSREWEYNGVQRRVQERELIQLSAGETQGKSVVEEELEVSL
jgi:hypothetical protein